jgi:cytochrome P450
MERVLGVYEEVVVDHQKNPRKDGLTRMLEAKAPDGTTLTVDAAKRELHHIVIAGLIVWAELATVLMALPEQTAVLDALRAEVDGMPAGPLTLETIAAAPLLGRVVMETKRMCPILPAPFGRAKKEFRVGGYTVPEGWMVLWGVHSTNRFAGIYTEPDRFDPSRFVPKSEGGRGEHEAHVHAFVPQGPGAPGGHRCPGLDFSTVFMSAFLVHLLRGYTWTLPEQAPGLRWNLIPPEPADGLRVKLTRRATTA